MQYLPEILMIIFAYLLGSIPFGVVVARGYGIKDITKHGSGNIGATNVLRVGGKKAGIITFLLDAVKGVIPILIAKELFEQDVVLLCGVAAVIGHIFPVWLKFKGGKGVATTIAVLLALHWPVGLLTVGAWIAAYVLFKISSLSAIISMGLTPVFAYFSSNDNFFYASLFLSALVIFRHKTNIERLLKGEEKKIR